MMRFISASVVPAVFIIFFFNDPAPTEIYTLPLHDALPIWWVRGYASILHGPGRAENDRGHDDGTQRRAVAEQGDGLVPLESGLLSLGLGSMKRNTLADVPQAVRDARVQLARSCIRLA